MPLEARKAMDTDEVLRPPRRSPGRHKSVAPAQREEMTKRYKEDPSLSLQKLADEYGVSRNAVWLIVQGDPWVQITKLKQHIKELEARLTAGERMQERVEA
jgi:predicted DNA-binding protein YlxM (UPF0122 family)